MKKMFILCLLVVSLLGCPFFNKPVNYTGSLVLSINSAGVKTIVPDIDMTIDTYDVYGSGPDGDSFEELGISAGTVIKEGLAIGPWTITVDARNSDGILIAKGTTIAIINDGEIISANVTVSPLSGTGELQLSVTWPPGVLANPVISSSLTPLGGLESTIDFSISDETATYEDLNIDTGYYTIKIHLFDGSTFVWGIMETGRIIAGETTSGTFNLTIDDINGVGGLTLEIEQDLQNPITIEFEGVQSTLILSNNLNISATPSGPEYSYQWYLSGNIIDGETNPSIVYGDTLSEGNYHLDLILTGENILSSNGFSFSVEREEIIIDHTCTDISLIPSSWIDVVKTMVLHHTGQSHGRQVPHGFENLELENSTYAVETSTEGIPAGTDVLKVTRGQRTQFSSWEDMIGPDRYWQDASGREWTERTLDYHTGNGDTVHASLHTWCWHLRTWTESQVDEYLASMEMLESEYPNVVFFYMTDTCDSTGDTGYNRWLRNEQIRQYCSDNNKMLFDFADLEAWSADGTQQNTYYHAASGLDIPYWHSDWTSEPFYNDGHINEAACTMKAKAMWWLLARIAGWSGS